MLSENSDSWCFDVISGHGKLLAKGGGSATSINSCYLAN